MERCDSRLNFIKECTKHVDIIIPSIITILEDNNIKFTVNKKETEIIISKKDKKEINSLIRTLSIPDKVLYFIIDVHQISDKVYIRKKIKK